MPMLNRSVYSSTRLLDAAGALSAGLNKYDVSAERNIVVHAFDPADCPDWGTLPAVWHQYDGATIHVNMGRFYDAAVNQFEDRAPFGEPLGPIRRARWFGVQEVHGESIVLGTDDLVREFSTMLDRRFTHPPYGSSSRRGTYKSFVNSRTRGGRRRVNPDPVKNTHRDLIQSGYDFSIVSTGDLGLLMYNMILGSVLREAGYSVFSHEMFRSEWYARATGYQRNIMAVLEEVRVDKQQTQRLGGRVDLENGRDTPIRKLFRSAGNVLLNADQVIGDMNRTVSTASGEGLSVANIALNSTLILGRVHSDILMPFEVRELADTLDTFIGTERIEAMNSIWSRYADITDADERNIMPLVKEWEELFPSDDDGGNAKSSSAPAPKPEPSPEDGDGESNGEGEGDGEEGEGNGEGEGSGEGEGNGEGSGEGKDGEGKGDGSGEGESADTTAQQGVPKESGKTNSELDKGKTGTKGAAATSTGAKNTTQKNTGDKPGTDELLDVKGLADALKQELESGGAVRSVARSAEHTDRNFGPRDITPSRISFAKAEHREPSRGSKSALADGTEIEPSASDHAAAKDLAKVLENLNVYDRGKFTTPQTLPPGRMRSRAAVQQAAERSLKLAPQAKPWSRTVRTVDMNPPLTVGIMTDVSGSQGWAEKLSARLAWIVQHAVSKVNGRTASLAFGEGVTVVLRPGERLERAQVVAANNRGEEFDMGAGTMDVMLNLVNGTGTRMLFVITDGYFVFENMLPKAKAWVDLLTRKGVHVVWITPDSTAMEPVERRDTSDGYPLTPDGVIPVSAVNLRNSRGDNREAEVRKLIATVGQQIQKAVRASKKH